LFAVGTRSTLREQVIGLLVALYLVTGRWSPARIFDLEPSMLLEPRVWAAAGLVLIAMLPSPPQVVVRSPASGTSGPVAWQIVYLGFAIVSIAWTPVLDDALEQAISAGLMIIVLSSLYRLCRTVDPLALNTSIWRALTGVLAGLAVIAIVGGLGSSRLAILGGGPNVFGRNMGLLCTIGLFNAIARGAVGRWAIVSPVAAALVVLSGSRGAMVATAVAIASLLFMGRHGLSRRLLAVGIFVSLSLLVVSYTELGVSVVESFSARVLQQVLAEGSVSSRDRIFSTALELGLASPVVGQGLGSFGEMTPWPYAHNMFFDAFAETGVIGLLLLVGALAHGGGTLLRYRSRQVSPATAAFILLGVASQFSGGLYDSRGVYVFLLLAIIVEPRALAARRAAEPPS